MATHIVALFNDRSQAENAVRTLTREGLAESRISVIAANQSGEAQLHTADDEGNLAAEGAKAGLTSGAVVGGAVGVLAGLTLGFVSFLGFLVAGPIAGLLTGAAAGAATGGALGGLVGLGIPEHEAEEYAERVRQGGTLVIADVDESNVDRFETVLNQAGAVDIDETRGQTSAPPRPTTPTPAMSVNPTPDPTPVSSFDNSQTDRTSQTADVAQGEMTIPVVEEQLQVGKREVESGGVRVRRFTTEQPVTAEVQLREEHVTVDRQRVDRPVTDADFNEKVIEVRETAEVPVVAKEARVVEEVTIGKQVETRTEQVSDTVRRTDVEIEQIEGANRAHFNQNYAGRDYAQYQPAYQYGSRVADDARYSGREYDQFEGDLRSDYETSNPGSRFDDVRDAIRAGYQNSRRKS